MAVSGTFLAKVKALFPGQGKAADGHENKAEPGNRVGSDAGLSLATAPPSAKVQSPVAEEHMPERVVRNAVLTSSPQPQTARPRPSTSSTPEVNPPACEVPLLVLERDLITLCNLTGSTLLRVKRPPAAPSIGPAGRRRSGLPGQSDPANGEAPGSPADAGAVDTNAGPLETGMELAQSIEQRARGLLLETSISPGQNERLDRVLQSVLDLICALRAARYAWQICHLLPDEGPAGRVALPRLRRVVAQTVEVSTRVIFVIEGQEGAAGAVAEHYRAFLAVKAETASHFGELREVGTLTQVARRLVRAALLSLTVSAESMAKVAARYSLPIGTASRELVRQQEKYRHLDRGDDLLAPLPRRVG